jgi:simple sugar transport system ATP-binding protein
MLEACEITKRYGAVLANDRVSLDIRPGEVLGLLGENGAGKSTLLGILSGMVPPDDGRLMLDGDPLELRGPADAIRHGIGMVYQHFSLVPTLSVREQLRLAGWREAELPAMLGDKITGRERIETLSLGEQQRVEIAKALLARPRILLLDEPTSILGPTEVSDLFDLVRAIRDQGVAVVLVTHKLREVLALADRTVVLRGGRVAAEAERPTDGWGADAEGELLRAMFGAAPEHLATDAPEGMVTGTIPLLTAAGLDARRVRDVSLTIHAREVCAVVGVDGQGQRELAEVLCGHRRAKGTIRMRERDLSGRGARRFARAGIGYLTDDRRGEGGVATLSVAANLMLKRQRRRPFSRFGLLNRLAMRSDARRLVARWGILPADVNAPLDTLSGGNIQKTLLAREMAVTPAVLIANKPTHGLDARTEALVWRAMRDITTRGGGVLVFTTDLDEALARADRVGVIFAGKISAFTPAQETSRDELARMMVAGW